MTEKQKFFLTKIRYSEDGEPDYIELRPILASCIEEAAEKFASRIDNRFWFSKSSDNRYDIEMPIGKTSRGKVGYVLRDECEL